jgi:hypothetical protein
MRRSFQGFGVSAEPSEFDFNYDGSPADEWDKDSARRALDELFSTARKYNASKDFEALLKFITGFRFYSPFNAMLVHIQMPGTTYVATPHRWLREYNREIKPSARPLVMLQPRGPVMFVFDVADTEPLPDAPPLPREVTDPFEVRRGRVRNELDLSVENAKRDGVRVSPQHAGSQSAGVVRSVAGDGTLQVLAKLKPHPEYTTVRLRYEVLLNAAHAPETKYASLTHELAHLYCGHLGTPNESWWPDRRGLSHTIEEFEAESVSYLVCRRLGIDTPAAEYVANYVGSNEIVPSISLECIMKAAGLIEQMGHVRLKPRKD